MFIKPGSLSNTIGRRSSLGSLGVETIRVGMCQRRVSRDPNSNTGWHMSFLPCNEGSNVIFSVLEVEPTDEREWEPKNKIPFVRQYTTRTTPKTGCRSFLDSTWLFVHSFGPLSRWLSRLGTLLMLWNWRWTTLWDSDFVCRLVKDLRTGSLWHYVIYKEQN